MCASMLGTPLEGRYEGLLLSILAHMTDGHLVFGRSFLAGNLRISGFVDHSELQMMPILVLWYYT